MRFIIIGGSSSLGSGFISFLRKKKIDYLGTFKSKKIKSLIKFDLTRDEINKKIKDLKKSDKIIIFSSISQPDRVTKKKKLAYRVNVEGTKKLIKDVSKIGCKVIFISTSEVFDGKKGSYKEDARANPLTTYGKHKELIEKYLKKKIIKNFTIIRLFWTIKMDINSRDVISLTYNSILKRNSVMAYDNYLNITDLKNVCDGIVKISKLNLKIVHLVNNEIISRYDLAKLIKKFSKKREKMSFTKIQFKKIKFLEKRGRMNFMNSKFHKNLNLKYNSIIQVVRKKVKVLDQ